MTALVQVRGALCRDVSRAAYKKDFADRNRLSDAALVFACG